ncbi:MAG: TonB-dependent receptor, partial [Acidobacteria bacterium]
MMALCFFSMNQASAQLNTADILGTVSDSEGAVVPNVKVTAQNIATNDTKTVMTSSTGDYVFNLMIPGQYTITAEAPSFKKSTVNLTVSAGDRARADIQLQVGDLDQVVEVVAQSPALQTD